MHLETIRVGGAVASVHSGHREHIISTDLIRRDAMQIRIANDDVVVQIN